MLNNEIPVLVKRSLFAQMARVDKSAITRAVQNGLLFPDTSGLLDIRHPMNEDYILRHGGTLNFSSPLPQFEPFDPDFSILWILIIDEGKYYKPVAVFELDSGQDMAARQIIFPNENAVTLVICDEIVKSVEIGFGENKKIYTPYYATSNQIMALPKKPNKQQAPSLGL